MALEVAFSHILVLAVSRIYVTTLLAMVLTLTIDGTRFGNEHTLHVVLGVGKDVKQ